MSTCTDKFHYDDLSEADPIRVLILHPGTLGSPIQSDPIHTRLRECRCDVHDNYTALSYVWGDANDTTYIVVDGFRFTVTANLAAALHDLHNEKRQLQLWADAVCINQTNNAERSQQVGLMKEIYSFAQNTVIYLGALLEHTKCLFEFMQQRDPDKSKLSGMADDALNDIVSRPWPLVRSWSLQEHIPIVDYNKSVEDVFLETACFASSFQSVDELLKVLRHADVNASHNRRSGLPSWVPDWAADENSLQGFPWFFGNTDTPEMTQVERWPLSSIDGDSKMMPSMSSMPVIPLHPHILSFI